jgi:hypothetical protein
LLPIHKETNNSEQQHEKSTMVQVTIEAGDLEKQFGACEGSVTKTITVHDNPKQPPVVK